MESPGSGLSPSCQLPSWVHAVFITTSLVAALAQACSVDGTRPNLPLQANKFTQPTDRESWLRATWCRLSSLGSRPRLRVRRGSCDRTRPGTPPGTHAAMTRLCYASTFCDSRFGGFAARRRSEARLFSETWCLQVFAFVDHLVHEAVLLTPAGRESIQTLKRCAMSTSGLARSCRCLGQFRRQVCAGQDKLIPKVPGSGYFECIAFGQSKCTCISFCKLRNGSRHLTTVVSLGNFPQWRIVPSMQFRRSGQSPQTSAR